jgi:hypothetical protein
MSVSFLKSIILVLAVLLSVSSYAAKPSTNYHRSFWQPYYLGQRLAYCTFDNQKCGMAVANQYCQIMGYERASKQMIANNIGLTHDIASHARCTGWQCNGFKTIECVSKLTHKPPSSYHYRLRRFVFPRFNNYRVDWCYDGRRQCGKRPAQSFCRRMGYRDARNYRIQKHVAATQAIGNEKLCFGQECNAFDVIDCYR